MMFRTTACRNELAKSPARAINALQNAIARPMITTRFFRSESLATGIAQSA